MSRARSHIERAKVRHATPPERQRQLLSAFGEAITTGSVDALAGMLSADVRLVGGEVTTSQIGLAVLDRLRLLDEVAYLRFASVYKNFDAAADFQSELELLSKLSSGPAASSA